jgi:hypothetical protein
MLGMGTTDELTAIVNTLDPDAIQDRLDDLDRQSKALRVLLRAARARERVRRHKAGTLAPAKGGPDHAS